MGKKNRRLPGPGYQDLNLRITKIHTAFFPAAGNWKPETGNNYY